MENVPFHKHDGTNSPRIDPKDLLGFPVFDVVPTFKAENGTIVLVDTGTNYYAYAMLSGTWRGVEFTL